MSQLVHIFKKDVRYLRKEISLVLGLTAIFAWKDLQWIEPLLIAASAWLIARLIHAEVIPGDRQFWVTRPYRWKSLLGAKLLFAFVFVNLPIATAQLLMLVTHGFSITTNIRGLLGSTVLLVCCVTVPIGALAAITPGIVPFIFASLILLTAGFLIPQLDLPGVLMRLWIPMAPPWPTPVEWVRDAAAAIALMGASASILYLQYRHRRTSGSRALALGAVGCAVVIWLFMPPWMALAFETRISSQPSESAMIQLSPNLHANELPYARVSWDQRQIHVLLPAVIKGLPGGFELRADALAVAFRSPNNRAWKSAAPSVIIRAGVDGSEVMDGVIPMPTSFLDQAGHRPLVLRASFYGTLFGNPRSQTIPIPTRPANVMEGLQCSLGEFNYLFCEFQYSHFLLALPRQPGCQSLRTPLDFGGIRERGNDRDQGTPGPLSP
jgi:hypothetical protein